MAKGADATARTLDSSTPLHTAAAQDTAETIQALLAAGSDVMAREADGWTPLHRAASYFYCNPDNIQTLLSASASVTAKDEDGKTPWDYLNKINI